jgi:hypothetical protein
MNLLELQVLSVISRIPDGNAALSPQFEIEPVAADPKAKVDGREPRRRRSAATNRRVTPSQ